MQSSSNCGYHRSVSPAHIGAVERAVLVKGEVPFARGTLLVVVDPDFGGVVSPTAVDVEGFARVGYGGNPMCVSKVITKLAEGCLNLQTYQYWPLPFLSGMICGEFESVG